MRKTLFAIIILLISFSAFSQSGLNNWDKKYRVTDIVKLLDSEKEYAKKVESDPSETQYYVALKKVRFIAEFTGKTRDLSNESLSSMKNVIKVSTGNSDFLNDLVSKEMEFKIEDLTIWLGIQNQLIKPFIEEVNKGNRVLLYCLFTNEHKFKGGYINSFLISEFTSDWK